MACGLALSGVGAACIPLAQGAGWPALALLIAHQIIGDGGDTLHDVHDCTLRQTAVDAAWLAHVDAGLRSIGQGATLGGAAAGGIVGTALSALAFAGASVWALMTLARREPAVATG